MALDVEQYYRKYGPMVMRRCRQLLRDEDEAADAMQDTFVRLIRYSDRLEEKGASSLLYTMATNVCLNRIRAAKRDQSDTAGDVLEEIAAVDDHADAVLAGHFLDRLFGGQKADTRTMAVCHYVDGMTLEQTANVCGLSISGVRKRLRTLRRSGLALKEA
ncbi:MAG: sigma-70 family RNA polymerase sigma factor [Spirochaeta sp.]|nr:sigma-70 family RNA polymerase sigma factor [Spirochaeta sp.]